MIDWTITQHARRTIRRISQNLSFGGKRTSRQGIRWAEDHNRWASESSADVCWSRVVGYDQIRAVEHCRNLIETRFSGQHHWLVLHLPHNLFRNIKLVLRSNQQHSSLRLDQTIRERREPLCRPALCTTVDRSRTDCDHSFSVVHSVSTKQLRGFRFSAFGNRDARIGLAFADVTAAKQHLLQRRD